MEPLTEQSEYGGTLYKCSICESHPLLETDFDYVPDEPGKSQLVCPNVQDHTCIIVLEMPGK